MQENPFLKKIQALLNTYFSYFKEENILVVSITKMHLPHMFIIKDDNFPKKLLVSFAVDYPNCASAVEAALKINKVLPVQIMEDFFITRCGRTYWGEEAHKYYEIESQCSLEDINPTNIHIH